MQPGRCLQGDEVSVLDLDLAVVSRFGPWRERCCAMTRFSYPPVRWRPRLAGMLRSHTAPRSLLLLLAIAGLLLPWRYNWLYFAGGGSVLPGAFFGQAFANALTTAITLDVYLAALAFSVGVAGDRAAGRRRWWAIPITFFVGLSFALPGYLWWRGGRGSAAA